MDDVTGTAKVLLERQQKIPNHNIVPKNLAERKL